MSTSLLDTYRRATPDQRERGRAWYVTMREACATIAREHGASLPRVVAACAITSPDAQLSTNLKWTREAVRTVGDAPVGRYPNAMRDRYRPILRGDADPDTAITGDKVRAFYRAILGDVDAVVLDRWALRAAGHHRDTATPKQYARIADEYRAIAASVGETPRDFQAIIWIVLREGHTRSNGQRVRLVDVHDLMTEEAA